MYELHRFLFLAFHALQMHRLHQIDAAITRVLGKDFSILGNQVKPVTEAFMKQICGLAPEAGGSTQTPAVLKIHRDQKLAAPPLSNSAVVLSVNLASVVLARCLSSDTPFESDCVEFLEFLLRFTEIGSAVSQTVSGKSHIMVNNRCMICTRCTFRCHALRLLHFSSVLNPQQVAFALAMDKTACTVALSIAPVTEAVHAVVVAGKADAKIAGYVKRVVLRFLVDHLLPKSSQHLNRKYLLVSIMRLKCSLLQLLITVKHMFLGMRIRCS
jgi:hypothetical protein